MAIEVNGVLLETDNEGYLLDPSDWNQEVALSLAAIELLEMNASRWQIVNIVRRHFEERQTVPEARTVLKALRELLGKEQATRKYLYGLFPYGYGQQACKIAGMRKPLKIMLDV